MVFEILMYKIFIHDQIPCFNSFITAQNNSLWYHCCGGRESGPAKFLPPVTACWRHFNFEPSNHFCPPFADKTQQPLHPLSGDESFELKVLNRLLPHQPCPSSSSISTFPNLFAPTRCLDYVFLVKRHHPQIQINLTSIVA